jgi:molecular chaperone GrpE
MTEEQKKAESPEVAPPPAPPTPPPDPIKQLESEVADFKDKYFRALAEIENTRKRLTREKIESQSWAIQNVVVDFLQPLDHFEVALKHAESATPEIKHWALGFAMILNQIKQVLSDHGVEPFESKGEPFDPHKHEAIETEERSDVPAGIVLEEFSRGWTLAKRVIRPAKVRVSEAPVVNTESDKKDPESKPEGTKV